MHADRPVRVWDLPTRLLHWLVAGLFVFSWWSSKSHHMDWHRISGIVLCGLLVFRVVWGFIGGSTARFAGFLRRPLTIVAYLGGRVQERPGHNPLGGYSVIALLALLIAQVGTGLFATDTDGLESGPLSYLVSFDASRSLAHVHGVIFNLLLALVVLHVGAIGFYLLARRRNLVTPMITGSDASYGTREGELVPAGLVALFVAAIFALGLGWWLLRASTF